MAKPELQFATYPQNYFTGAQAKIFFGSVWVDDIATIQYSTSHSKTPLYGYGDHLFRTIAKGQFLVRGSFTIAFKESGYLYEITRLMREDLPIPKAEQNVATYMQYFQQGYTPEEILDMVSSTNRSGVTFEDMASVIEDGIWGKKNELGTSPNRIPRTDELDYNRYTNGNTGEDNDIDIGGFDILMTLGDYRYGSESAVHTMVSLIGVHITGEQMIVSPSAEPIGLTCEFFARSINEKVSSAWSEPDTIAASYNNHDIVGSSTPINESGTSHISSTPSAPRMGIELGANTTVYNKSAFIEYAKKVTKEKNILDGLICAIIQRECSWNMYAKPTHKDKNIGVIVEDSSAKGLGQFINSEAKRWGIETRVDANGREFLDPYQSIDAVANSYLNNLARYKVPELAAVSHYAGANHFGNFNISPDAAGLRYVRTHPYKEGGLTPDMNNWLNDVFTFKDKSEYKGGDVQK